MNNLRYALSLLCIILISCTKSTKAGFQFENKDETLISNVVVIDSTLFRYPFRIKKKDSVFYILDLHGRDFYCSQISYPSTTLRKDFASRGSGPDDFLSVESIRLSSSGKLLYLLDANKESIIIYDSEKDSINKRINLPKHLIRSLDFALINDSLFVIADYTGKCRVHIMDIKGNIHKHLFQISTQKKENVSDIVLAQAWRSFLDYNPTNGILAMATQLSQVIEIYN